jgi:hypothetical protein
MPDFKIGPNFADEVRAAGIDMDGWAWNIVTGEVTFNDDVPQETRDGVAAVYAKHDPTKPRADDGITHGDVGAAGRR